MPDEDFPIEEINALGYDVAFHGQKTHYGVAIMYRAEAEAIQKGFVTDDDDSQKRFISGTFTTSDGRPFTFINGYFPQGESRHHPVKFPGKEKFYSDLSSHLAANHAPEIGRAHV